MTRSNQLRSALCASLSNRLSSVLAQVQWRFGAAAVLAACLTGSPTASGAIYIDFGDFPGEATKEPHVEWIDVLALSTGDYRPGTFFGARAEWADSTLQDIVVTKEVDKSTPKISESILAGTVHDKVVIDFAASGPANLEPSYFMIELKDVRVTSQSFTDRGETSPAREMFSLIPEKIKWVYPNLGESGQEGRIEFAWDVIGGQPAGTTSVPGDYDANGLVGGGDFLVWQRRQGALLNSRDDGADIGAIGHELLDIWAGNFGYRQDATRGASITSIPEPGACTLIGLGAALAFFYRHRRFRPLP